MATKAKVSIRYGYTLKIDEDGTLFLKVETADETLEFEGKNGYLYFWSECVDDEDIEASPRLTLDEMLSYTKEYLNDSNVDEETTEALLCDLTPWFKEFAISENESKMKKIEELSIWIDCRRKCIEERTKWINEECEQIAKRIAESDRRIKQRKDEISNLNAEISRFTQQIAELQTSLNKEKFISVDPEYTGGGIYVFTGKLADGNFFMADTANYDVRLLTEDPNEPTGMDTLGIVERNIDSVEWQEEHLVKDLSPDEAVKFFKAMLDWVAENDPSGNYLGADMDYFRNELDNLHGDWR